MGGDEAHLRVGITSGIAALILGELSHITINFLVRRRRYFQAERNAAKCPALAAIRAEAKAYRCGSSSAAQRLAASILTQRSFEEIMAARLAVLLKDDVIRARDLEPLFLRILLNQEYEPGMGTVGSLAQADLDCIGDRDPAYAGPLSALLCFKGYQAIQAHRIAHVMWTKGCKTWALLVQSRASQVFSVDIHPGAILGKGLMIDHGTGVVIGETAVLGPDCTLLHNVTLGATGKDKGDRHPKLGEGVLVGTGACILGNINIGDGCKIGAHSVVLKSLPSGATAIGIPAKIVGRAKEEKPGKEMDTSLKQVVKYEPSNPEDNYQSHWLDSVKHVCPLKCEKKQQLRLEQVQERLKALSPNSPLTEEQVDGIFFALDTNCEGTVAKKDFDSKAQDVMKTMKQRYKRSYSDPSPPDSPTLKQTKSLTSQVQRRLTNGKL
ncbi:hypothetical protein CYMTET_42996 [Cymbomonas tetramitiformis]|uniref:serine O-acetyltransferase n=1 Tax=Cymbomonas tetramitiformis TaxID=36881 RepID=A0AAE0F0G0_9CHLO|nr:hypothetical protein CYMTET_42996 [Cymbomonas tetramitiformis]